MEKLVKYKPFTPKAHLHEVSLSDRAVEEVDELLKLYYKKHELSTPIPLSKLCTIGLMMLGSLSVSEFEECLKWYKLGGY